MLHQQINAAPTDQGAPVAVWASQFARLSPEGKTEALMALAGGQGAKAVRA